MDNLGELMHLTILSLSVYDHCICQCLFKYYLSVFCNFQHKDPISAEVYTSFMLFGATINGMLTLVATCALG